MTSITSFNYHLCFQIYLFRWRTVPLCCLIHHLNHLLEDFPLEVVPPGHELVLCLLWERRARLRQGTDVRLSVELTDVREECIELRCRQLWDLPLKLALQTNPNFGHTIISYRFVRRALFEKLAKSHVRVIVLVKPVAVTSLQYQTVVFMSPHVNTSVLTGMYEGNFIVI